MTNNKQAIIHIDLGTATCQYNDNGKIDNQFLGEVSESYLNRFIDKVKSEGYEVLIIDDSE